MRGRSGAGLKFALLFFSFSAFAEINNFREAKKALFRIHLDHPYTLYCGCKYSGQTVDLKSCGYIPRKDNKLAHIIEWEHVVPAHAFGQAFIEWREGAPKCKDRKKKKLYKGRKCARKNPVFAKMEGDLYNLYPEIDELNRLRSNFSMAMLTKSPKDITFGACTARVQERKFEPMDQAKGIVARTYMYMDQTYPGRGIISSKNEKLFAAWNKQFAVVKWECERAKRIEALTKKINPILKQACLNL